MPPAPPGPEDLSALVTLRGRALEKLRFFVISPAHWGEEMTWCDLTTVKCHHRCCGSPQPATSASDVGKLTTGTCPSHLDALERKSSFWVGISECGVARQFVGANARPIFHRSYRTGDNGGDTWHGIGLEQCRTDVDLAAPFAKSDTAPELLQKQTPEHTAAEVRNETGIRKPDPLCSNRFCSFFKRASTLPSDKNLPNIPPLDLSLNAQFFGTR